MDAYSQAEQRTSIVLPVAWTRWSWASPAARLQWAPQIQRIMQILPALEQQLMGQVPDCCQRASVALDPTWEQLQTTDFTAPCLANTLWRPLGVGLVTHRPCAFSCPDSNALAQEILARGRRAGYYTEMEAVCDILAWPARWSRLFGIAELVTPYLKLSTRSDWTAALQEFVIPAGAAR